MRQALRSVPFVLLLSLLLLPAAAGAFTLSLPADSAVTIDSPSRLAFTVTNTEGQERLSRLTFRFPSDYRVAGGSAPPGWAVEQSSGSAAEISFRTSDEAKCSGAIAPGSSLVFSVDVIAQASGGNSPDSLISAQAEQSCRGVTLDPPPTLPSWDRLGLGTTLAAGPTTIGLGGIVTATMSVTNRSTVQLADISVLLNATGTGSVSGVVGPTPATLTLAPGASGSITWTARTASAGTLSFSSQALSKRVTSPAVRSDTLFVGDLDVSLGVTPGQVLSGQDVQVQMTVTNRGPVSVTDVIPSAVAFQGTAAGRLAAGPSPSSWPVLEPGASATFAWAATITGRAGDTYMFSGGASAEGDGIVSQNATSNGGALALGEEGNPPTNDGGGGSLESGGGVAASATTASTAPTGGSATTASTASGGGSVPTALPSATLRFIGVNQDGRLTGGPAFLSGMLRDLRILVGWQNLSSSHTQRLDLYSPDGSLYQRFSTQFANASSVQADLPVGGTWITEFSLFGAWQVDVFLDTGTMPITTGVFVLTP